MAKLDDLLAKLNVLGATLVQIKQETTYLIKAVEELREHPSEDIPLAVFDKLDAILDIAQSIDNLVVNTELAEPSDTGETGADGGTEETAGEAA